MFHPIGPAGGVRRSLAGFVRAPHVAADLFLRTEPFAVSSAVSEVFFRTSK